MKLHRPRLRRPAPATVIASLALFVAVGGPAEAAKLINGKTIKRGTITSKQIKDRGVSLRDLTVGTRNSLRETPAGSVGTAQLRDSSVGAAQLQPGAITASALGVGVVNGSTILDKGVGTADLADSSVTTEKIGSSEVRKADIGTGAVGQSEIAQGAITGGEVADGALTAADVADAFGAVTFDFPVLLKGTCAASAPLALSTVKASEAVSDDALTVTPPVGWPAYLTVQAVPANTSTGSGARVVLNVCNLDDTTPSHDPSSNTFNVVGVDLT